MKILAIDSSGTTASAAIVEDCLVTAEYTVTHKKTHSQTLLPMIDEIVKMTETELSSIDAIAVACGPGSFTGLRIGSATVKGLALVLEKPIVEVPTVDALAYGVFSKDCVICPLMDARRQEVYTGIYEFVGGDTTLYDDDKKSGFRCIKEQTAMPVKSILEELNSLNRDVIFLGDGVAVYKDIIESELNVAHFYAPAHLLLQSAASVGTLGLLYFQAGKIVSADEHSPVYLRLSQAERELLEKNK